MPIGPTHTAISFPCHAAPGSFHCLQMPMHILWFLHLPRTVCGIISKELPAASYPFTLPAVKPCTKNFWQEMKTIKIGIRLSTDSANT